VGLAVIYCTRCGAQKPPTNNLYGWCPACEAAARTDVARSAGSPVVYLSEDDVRRIADAVAERIARLRGGEAGCRGGSR
jgi:hypothetical protein